MSDIFLKILNMSIAASWLILAVMLFRFILKKVPKWITVLLWGIVAFRLVVPFSFESALSLIPSAETFNAHNIQYETPAISSGIPAINNAVNPVLGETFAPNPAGSVNPLYVWTFIVSVVWLIGIAAMLLYAVISYVRVRWSVAERIPYEGNIFLCDHVKSPFILGLVRPKICLPSNMDATAMEPVIAHEKAHLARHDHWWKPLGFLILMVHWFNPLCWIAYVLLCRDIELACDEKVIRQMDLEGKKQYSTALLECNTQRRLVTICPLAFGEVGVKERVKNVLNYKKPAFWVIVVAVIACAVVTVCFATNPSEKNTIKQIEADRVIISHEIEDGVYDAQTTITDEEIVAEIVLMHNTIQIQEMSRPMAQDRFVLTFYSGEDTVTTWWIALWDDGTIITAADTFGLGNHVVTNDFDYDRLAEMLDSSIDVANTVGGRKLTFDDVVTLSQKGDALTWSDFEPYQGREVGSGLYIMRYEIDKLFDVLVGGVPEATPMYIYLRVHNEAEDHIDIRTGDVSAFIEAHRNDALKVDELSAALNKLEYQPFTCDGLPEYKLYDTDGTVYSINFSEKWVWRGNSEQAELSDELIRLLRESGVLVAGEDTPTPAGPDAAATTLSEEQAVIHQAILERNRSADPTGFVSCASFAEIACIVADGSDFSEYIHYGWALYEEYRVTDNGLKTVRGSHVPVAITFREDPSGTLTLEEYWQPRDGSYYAPDIREKFPAHIAEDALDNQKFILQQTQECYAQAVASTGLDTDKVIGTLIETICSSPAEASNPWAYIKEHSIEYRELTYYGRYTLKYCFARFEEGGETGLAGHIMRQACEDIAVGWGEEPLVFSLPDNGVFTGQMWYSAFKNNALSLMEQYSEIELAERYPASYLLLSMLGEV